MRQLIYFNNFKKIRELHLYRAMLQGLSVPNLGVLALAQSIFVFWAQLPVVNGVGSTTIFLLYCFSVHIFWK